MAISKILSMDALSEWCELKRTEGQFVTHCHGVFDLLHPGHLRHLEEAKDLGGVVVVTVTSDRYVNKGPGRPLMNGLERVQLLAALSIVDAVAISDHSSGVPAIQAVRPKYYVKGPDYKDPDKDLSGNMRREIEMVESLGGELHLTRGETMSSSNIRNNLLLEKGGEEADFLRELRRTVNSELVDSLFSRIADLKVLVVGEAIIDTYITCEALGKSSKDPVLAFKPLASESQLGGSLAIARHLAGLGAKPAIVCRVGRGDSWGETIAREMPTSVSLTLLESEDEPTIQKTRYVDAVTGNKVFETYKIGDSLPSNSDSEIFAENLQKMVKNFDLVLVADYGHGLLDETAIRILTESEKMMAVNTQSNAGNRGFNTVSKYPRVDIICLNGSEVALELRRLDRDVVQLVPEFMEFSGANFVAITSGSQGVTYGQRKNGGIAVSNAPAFTTKVVDRVGAGDALFAALSVFLAVGASPQVAALAGNLAGATSIAEMGNRVAIDAVSMRRHLEALLK